MIDILHVSKAFDGKPVLEDLSLQVENGSIYGLIGYNGAGKTTLMKMIADVYRADSGDILLDGRSSLDNEAVKRELFLLPDEFYLLAQATPRSMANFYRGFYPRWNQQTFEKICALFELDIRKRIRSYSKGMQRQAYLALALASHPRYLLLDETFDGLDPVKRNLTRQILLEYIAEREVCVLLSSHNLGELEGVCDHFGLINAHHLVFDGAMEEIQKQIAKFRLIFNHPIEEAAFQAYDYRAYSCTGNIVTLTIRGDTAAVEAQLRELAPQRIETFPLSLEEIFLNEMNEEQQDLAGLF